jgi:ankyrin repeat protein
LEKNFGIDIIKQIPLDKADLSRTNSQLRQPLEFAIVKAFSNKSLVGAGGVLWYLAEQCQKLNVCDGNGNTPLHKVIVAPNPAPLINHLIKLSQNSVIVRNNDGNTPLHLAIQKNSPFEVIQALTQSDAINQSLSLRNNMSHSPFHDAMIYGSDLQTVSQLVTLSGASEALLITDVNSHQTPLHLGLVYNRSQDIIKLLVTVASNALLTADHRGLTPIHIAAQTNVHINVVKYLLTWPLCIQALSMKSNTGWTPLHYLARSKMNVEIVKLFAVVDKNLLKIQNKEKETPLQLALRSNTNKDIAKHLISDDALITKQEQGRTPLHHAIRYGLGFELIQALINPNRGGLALSVQDQNGETPLHFAARYNIDLKIVQYLLSFMKGDSSPLLIREYQHGDTPTKVAILFGTSFPVIQAFIEYDRLDEVLSAHKKDCGSTETVLHAAVQRCSDESQLIEYILEFVLQKV